MLFLREAHSHCAGTSVSSPVIPRAERARVQEPLSDSIPFRYRDGRGGVDLERVRQDQLKARQDAVRTMLQRLKELWHR